MTDTIGAALEPTTRRAFIPSVYVEAYLSNPLLELLVRGYPANWPNEEEREAMKALTVAGSEWWKHNRAQLVLTKKGQFRKRRLGISRNKFMIAAWRETVSVLEA